MTPPSPPSQPSLGPAARLWLALVLLTAALSWVGASPSVAASTGTPTGTLTGALTGTVLAPTDAGGYPLDDVLVEARPAATPSAAPSAWTVTAGGDWSLDLPAGSYVLALTDLGAPGTWQDTSYGAEVGVVAGTTTATSPVRPARLAEAAVSGLVVDGTTAAAPGASVTLYRRVAGLALDDPWVAVDTTETGNDGRYAFTGAAVGRTYSVAATRSGSPTRWLGGARTAAGATTVTAQATNAVATIALPPSSTLTGSVTRGGVAAPDVEVQAYEWRDGRFEAAGTDVTGDAGRFQVAVPGSGTYALRFVDEQRDDSSWANGGSLRPTTLAAAGRTFVVGTDGSAVDAGGFAFTPPPRGTGRVLSGSTPLADATVRVLAFDGTAWRPTGQSATTSPTGTYDLALPRSGRATVRVVAAGHLPSYWNGVAPAGSGTDADSRLVTGGTSFGDLALQRRTTSSLGRVAGQDLATCRQHTLASGDGDASSGPITLPFPVRFFGTTQTEAFVSDNGLVSFGGPVASSAGSGGGDYLPTDLATLDQPVLAPFWADTDTRGERSDQVTWGTSGDLLCVSWTDVGSFDGRDEQLNSVQLLLTPASGSGRAAGDVDVRFNYDRLQWDTGVASEGFPAVAGLTAGTGESGTTVQLPGSGIAGALLDGGPNALVAGSRGSTQPGRYVFEVRNEPAAPTEPTPPPAPVTPTNLVAPSVGGTPKVGATLTADPGFWMPEDATPSLTWLRDDVPVPGATGPTYVVGAADVGARLAVRVTTGGGSYVTSPPVTSEAVTVPRVVSTSTARMAAATIRRSTYPKVVVRVAAAPVLPTGTVLIKVKGVVRARATLTALGRGTVTVRLPRLARGRYSVVAVFGGSSVVAPSTSRAVALNVTR